MPDVWELWQRAKTLEWDPQTDIPWEELHPERYGAEQLLAAQMYWSRRTWGEYGAISESPALLLRFVPRAAAARSCSSSSRCAPWRRDATPRPRG